MSELMVTGDFSDLGEDSAGPLGIVMINSSDIGTVQGIGKAAFEAREIVNIDGRSVSYVIRVDLSGAGDYPSSSTATVSPDEVDRIAAAIDRLKLASPKMTKFKSFEARFQSEDKMTIAVFVGRNGVLMAAVSHGSTSVYLSSMADLDRFKTLLVSARGYIEANRFAPPR